MNMCWRCKLNMKEFRIHGRGGQGSVVTAELIAIAAFENGYESQAFPDLGGGGERRGAPVQAFARVSDKPVRLKCAIEKPNFVIIQDVSLIGIVDLLKGIEKDGIILINTEKSIDELGWEVDEGIDLYIFPATKTALEVLGKPLMNTSMLGALAEICEEISVESLQKAVKKKFPGEIGEKNAKAVQVANEKTKEIWQMIT